MFFFLHASSGISTNNPAKTALGESNQRLVLHLPNAPCKAHHVHGGARWHPDAHLSVRHAVAALTGRPRPTSIPLPLLLAVVLPVTGVPVSVVPLGGIALLVYRPVVVVVVVVVLAVFGPAPVPVPVPVFAWEVT